MGPQERKQTAVYRNDVPVCGGLFVLKAEAGEEVHSQRKRRWKPLSRGQ
jgi:hypothetical protein